MDLFLPHLCLSELEEECFSKVLPKVCQQIPYTVSRCPKHNSYPYFDIVYLICISLQESH